MSLLAVSTIILCILINGRPYLDRFSTFTIVSHEFLFAYLVVFCLLFSPEYMHRFVETAADFGNAICLAISTVAAAGIINLTYSIIWQILYNRRLRDSIVKHKELMKNR